MYDQQPQQRPRRPQQGRPRGPRPQGSQGRPPQGRQQGRPPQRPRRPQQVAPQGYYQEPPRGYYQEPPKKKFKWWYIPIGIVVFFILIGIFSGGDDDKPKKADAGNDQQVEQPAEADDQTVFAVGDPVDIGKATITVTAIERDPDGKEFNEPPDGKEFLHVQLQIENTGKKNYQLYPYNQKVRTSNGELLTFDVFASAIKESESMEMIEIAPGGKTTGWISFTIPKDDDAVFMYFDNVLSDTPTFEVPVP